MGCDIHPVCQVKDPVIGWWQNVGIPDSRRNYDFFYALAGARYGGARFPLAPHRGFPDDARGLYGAVFDAAVDGDHSESWCLLSEMESHDTTGIGDDYGKPMWDRWIEFGRFMAKHFEVPHDHVRFVFNFDS